MPQLAVNHTQVNYSSQGDGPALVLVHGTSVDAQANFGHLAERFADRRRVVLPNYGGNGGSTLPPGPLRLDTLVEQIAAVIDDASPEQPVDLLGDSLGAVVAAAVAARHPQRIRRLILVAGWANSHDARHQMVFRGWADLLQADNALCNRYAAALALSPAFLSALGEDVITAFLRQTPPPDTLRRVELGLGIDIRNAASAIAAPTLVIAGKQDYLVPAYQTQDLQQRIAGSLYAEVDAGHGVLLEQPDRVVELVRKFLLD
ncbi:alpha/beta fold hydrolase [Chromobacterium sp. IIBBL 290-4]|uniref:alpha/beta fold hydrolase n=1 Tax=Chromobacterium sp. IIBBL 290-4 TaxID=2953890 RepID=UPI0020B7DC2A|nr:alpha/beta fold hydrolase [Chromobacterium sp. IIBBL 290-4]UTH76124.1 alpha/beta hydrolase [Chromobacterium sp. IIBBL 290-4]